MTLSGTDVVPDVDKVPNCSIVFQNGLIKKFGTSIVSFYSYAVISLQHGAEVLQDPAN